MCHLLPYAEKESSPCETQRELGDDIFVLALGLRLSKNISSLKNKNEKPKSPVSWISGRGARGRLLL